VKLWDVNTGALMRLFPGCHSADFSPDGTMIACPSALASADKTVGKVDLYKLQDGSLVKSLVSEKAAATSFLESVTFSPDGHWLAAADWNGTVSLWNVASGQRKQISVRTSAGVLSAAFTPEGGTLATGGEDKILHLWKLSAQKIEPVSPK
jgi:WD40 repeat protein